MFFSQPENRPSTVMESASKSQPQPSGLNYHWVVLFQFDIENHEPFNMFLRSTFPESEVPESWYKFKLEDELRLLKRYFRTLNGEYAVFCKVEKGKILPIFILKYIGAVKLQVYVFSKRYHRRKILSDLIIFLTFNYLRSPFFKI